MRILNIKMNEVKENIIIIIIYFGCEFIHWKSSLDLMIEMEIELDWVEMLCFGVKWEFGERKMIITWADVHFMWFWFSDLNSFF